MKDIIKRKVGGVHMELKPWMLAAMEEKGQNKERSIVL